MYQIFFLIPSTLCGSPPPPGFHTSLCLYLLTSFFQSGWLVKYGLLRRLLSLLSSLLVRGIRTLSGTRSLQNEKLISLKNKEINFPKMVNTCILMMKVDVFALLLKRHTEDVRV